MCNFNFCSCTVFKYCSLLSKYKWQIVSVACRARVITVNWFQSRCEWLTEMKIIRLTADPIEGSAIVTTAVQSMAYGTYLWTVTHTNKIK